MCTISREEYDLHRIRILMSAGRVAGDASEETARRHVENEYPMSTDNAISELRFRGLDATDWRIEKYCRDSQYAPPMVGGVRFWTREAIDRMAEAMERYGELTPSALYRKEKGLSWAEETEMLHRHNEAKREVNHADDE
jgi:hypothetical protein